MDALRWLIRPIQVVQSVPSILWFIQSMIPSDQWFMPPVVSRLIPSGQFCLVWLNLFNRSDWFLSLHSDLNGSIGSILSTLSFHLIDVIQSTTHPIIDSSNRWIVSAINPSGSSFMLSAQHRLLSYSIGCYHIPSFTIFPIVARHGCYRVRSNNFNHVMIHPSFAKLPIDTPNGCSQ